jgi:hypothetical protein
MIILFLVAMAFIVVQQVNRPSRNINYCKIPNGYKADPKNPCLDMPENNPEERQNKLMCHMGYWVTSCNGGKV